MTDLSTMNKIQALLDRKIGLSAEAIGSEVILNAVKRRMADCGCIDAADYYDFLNASYKEQEELIESVVVPETWFFRNQASFAFLGRYVRHEWSQEGGGDILRVLSIPCATGEEPYSVAMTLLDAGVAPGAFHIDAADVSNRALQKAEAGVFGRESYRGADLSYRDRHFDPVSGGHRIHDAVREKVRFFRGNVLDDRLLSRERPYQAVFCRNLLIYLSAEAREKTLRNINRLLSATGLLFVGHVERQLVTGYDFEWIRQTGVFACRRGKGRTAVFDLPRNAPPAPAGRPGRTTAPPPRSQPKKTAFNAFAPECPPPASRFLMKDDRRSSEQNGDILENAHQQADKGNMEEAMKLCRECLNKDAFNIHAHFLMGLIWHALDDEEKAEACFNKAVYLDPNHDEALSHLAFIVEHRGDRRRAEQLRQRVHRIRTRTPQ